MTESAREIGDRAPEISIVLAVPGLDDDVARPLNALRAAAAEMSEDAAEAVLAEVIVVMAAAGPAGLTRRAIESCDGLAITLLQAPAGALTPCLWAAGYRRARGRIVAFTTAQCTVTPSWIGAIRAGIAAGHAGVGGPLRLDRGASATDWAVFHLRYNAFLSAPAEHAVAHEIAGDNAAYSREALARHDTAMRDGFWEVELHRRLRAEGHTLRLMPAMAVTFEGAPRVWTLAAHRFAHGKHSGFWRVATGARSAWQIAAAAPLVPGLLMMRTVRAVQRNGGTLRFAALPAFALLAAAWAAGEVVGALRPRTAPVSCPGE